MAQRYALLLSLNSIENNTKIVGISTRGNKRMCCCRTASLNRIAGGGEVCPEHEQRDVDIGACCSYFGLAYYTHLRFLATTEHLQPSGQPRDTSTGFLDCCLY